MTKEAIKHNNVDVKKIGKQITTLDYTIFIYIYIYHKE